MEAREIAQAGTLMSALSFTSLTHLLCGNYVTANALLGELVNLADEKGALQWKAIGTLFQGRLHALADKASAAVETITFGLTAYRSVGATLSTASSLSYLAKAFAELGQFDDAWRCIGEATTVIETTGERWFESEVKRALPEKSR
jgi:hypothetical protein